jgi:hypothetical protein
LTGDGDDGEAASEERMGRVGYLDLLGRGLGRVVDGGIKARLRLIRSTTAISGIFSSAGYETESFSD